MELRSLVSSLFWICLIVVIPVIFVYNRIVKYENQAKSAFSTVDIMLQKRYDLIPNLVATVKGYMKHEQTVLEEIAKIRMQAMGKSSEAEVVQVNDQLTKSMNNLYMLAENYPSLKADKLFLQLSQELTSIENELSAGRRAYNASVTNFNNAIMTFPQSILANMMNKKEMSFFKASLDVSQVKHFTINMQ